MSIKIYNGYRIKTDNPDGLLHAAEAVLAPVRNLLDARLYANIVATLIDGRDLRGRPFSGKVKDEALVEFLDDVRDGPYRWNHPHSLDLDYGYPSTDSGHLFVLLHCQREEYETAFEALPDVEPFPYWNNSDGPDDLTNTDWDERRDAWEWLISAHRISDVMTRWTHRSDPAPDHAHVLDTNTVLACLPTPDQRAQAIAREMVMAEHFAGATDMIDRMGEVSEVISSPAVNERAALIIPTLRTITANDLN